MPCASHHGLVKSFPFIIILHHHPVPPLFHFKLSALCSSSCLLACNHFTLAVTLRMRRSVPQKCLSSALKEAETTDPHAGTSPAAIWRQEGGGTSLSAWKAMGSQERALKAVEQHRACKHFITAEHEAPLSSVKTRHLSLA